MKEELPKEFIGAGEVKGFSFNRVYSNDYASVYKVKVPETECIHYEVFERKFARICIDFENKVFSETDFREKYPKSKDFGVCAFTKKSFEDAINVAKNIYILKQ